MPEIQEMLEKLPAPAPGAKCHERLGWMPSGMDDRCREIINKLLSNLRTALLHYKIVLDIQIQ